MIPQRIRETVTIALAMTIVAALGCTDSGLQVYAPSTDSTYDDKLTVDGRVCTSIPDDTVFLVKVLFVVDTSNSMVVTDPGALRAQAIADVMRRFQGNPSVEFALITFSSIITRYPAPTPDPADPLQRIPTFTSTPNLGTVATLAGQQDYVTDYTGALGAAYTLLSQDMQQSPPAERARSKYIVIFFSDGTPDPKCSATLPSPPDYLVCETPRDDWDDIGIPDTTVFADMQAGADYNQPYQINQLVDNLIRLQDIYRVGEVRMHTAFLFDPAALTNPLGIAFNLDRQAGLDLLTQMADHGEGTFTEFSSATEIDFFNVNYTAIRSPNALAQLVGWNNNTWLRGGALEVDTDGDGLADEAEVAKKSCQGMNPGCLTPVDSDADGYGDLVEELNLAAGYDPRDATKPASSCPAAQRNDSDGDGLNNCEESTLGTHPDLFDTDGDRLPDFLEVRSGLNPRDPSDALADGNYNGVRNVDELRAHLNPLTAGPPAEEENDDRYITEVLGTEQMSDGRTCYDFAVRNIRLMTTGAGTQSVRGENKIYVYFVEAPLDRPTDYGSLQMACVRTRYVDGVLKNPPSGKFTFAETDFHWPLDDANHCIDLTAVGGFLDGGLGDGGLVDGGAAD